MTNAILERRNWCLPGGLIECNIYTMFSPADQTARLDFMESLRFRNFCHLELTSQDIGFAGFFHKIVPWPWPGNYGQLIIDSTSGDIALSVRGTTENPGYLEGLDFLAGCLTDSDLTLSTWKPELAGDGCAVVFPEKSDALLLSEFLRSRRLFFADNFSERFGSSLGFCDLVQTEYGVEIVQGN